MMVISIEVKGGKLCLSYSHHIWLKESLMQAKNDNNLMEVICQQRSNINYMLLVKRTADASFRVMMIFTEVTGQQRSK